MTVTKPEIEMIKTDILVIDGGSAGCMAVQGSRWTQKQQHLYKACMLP
jgi:hypothetical protein